MPGIIRLCRWLLPVMFVSCLPMLGCATSRFRVIDGATEMRLEGVQVDGYRFRPLQQVPTDYAWYPIEVDPTDHNGMIVTANPLSFVQGENEFHFVFTKAGYRSAEALVSPGKAELVSPADDAGWKTESTPHHLVNNLPTRNFEAVSGKGEMTIRLYRDESVALEPSTPPANTVAGDGQ